MSRRLPAPPPGRHRLAVLATLLLAAVAGCGHIDPPAGCDGDAACPGGGWCRSGQCVANAPPVAEIDPPATAGTNRPLTFRGGRSHDADPGDAIAAHAWRASPPAGTTGCEPAPSTGTGEDLTVVFPCPGEHEVSLVVTDTRGLAGAPRAVRVAVEPTLDPPLLVAGDDVAVDHRCAGAPLRCTTWDGAQDAVQLAARAEGPAGVPFTWRWSVELPAALAGAAAPRVTFLPSDAVASPLVRIETEGGPIAGRYVFVVTAVDARGMVATGRQRVDVGNRPPVLVGGGRLAIPHGYEAGTRRFVAVGETPPAAWSDPDGDPVTPLGFTVRHSGDGDGLFQAQDLVDRARVTVVVPHAGPASAGFLIGPGVRRSVDLVVADANGAQASATWEVEVTNRPPRLAAAVSGSSVDHTYEAAFQRYAAVAPLSTWVDDDGDPLTLTLSGDAACAEVAERSGTAWVTCSTPFTGLPDPGRLVGTHALVVSAADPFEPGPSQGASLEIRNRPPRIVARDLTVRMPCQAGATCCTPGLQKGTCEERDHVFVQTTLATPLVVDDDGDPLEVSATPLGDCLTAAPVSHPCTGAGCSPALTLCGGRWTCAEWTPTGQLSLAATDGMVSALGAVDVSGVCAP